MEFLYFSSQVVLAFLIPVIKVDKRIGPHNSDVISVLVGSLLGDGYAERSLTGGIKFKFRQNIKHKAARAQRALHLSALRAGDAYLFWLYEFFNSRGYCTNNLPTYFVQKYGEKLYEAYRFNLYSFSSFL